jgi:ribose-phosphate pyrophosphokinase
MVNLVLAYPEEAQPACLLSTALGCELALVRRHVFPDGESKLTLPAQLPPNVVLWRGLHQPNAKLAELMLLVPACRELGASHLQLVSPYLAYMRQDIAFNPGEVVSQRHLARLLGTWFDRVVTVDPHLHRIASLDEVMPPGRGFALTAAPLLGEWLVQQVEAPVLLAPDEEALQWVQAAANAKRLPHGACHKVRRGDRDVYVTLPQGLDINGRRVVLLDDVASTGRTLAQAAVAALAAGATSVDAAVTHALFMPGALEDLATAGVRHVWSTDSVPHPSNVVSLAPLLAAALR